MRRLTVVGARGFIGSHLVRHAQRRGWDVLACRHDAVPRERLGAVAYCSGIAWDADRRPLEAFAMHARAVEAIVRDREHERMLYLSSTRVYDRAASTNETQAPAIRPGDTADTYAASKLAGERVVLEASPENRVVRASNVYGDSLRSQLFLSDILRQAAGGHIALRSARESSKDYVAVGDLCERVLDVLDGSRERIYNVAAGRNTTHGAILDAIARETPIEVTIPPDAPVMVVPEVDVARLQAEFPFVPRDVVADIPELVRAFRGSGG